MKFWIATKGIVYNPSRYMDGNVRWFTTKEKAMDWLGYVGKKQCETPGYEWCARENTLEEADIEEGV